MRRKRSTDGGRSPIISSIERGKDRICPRFKLCWVKRREDLPRNVCKEKKGPKKKKEENSI